MKSRLTDFALAISSLVFYSIFYDEMKECTNTIKLPDCIKDSLLEFLRYIYSNEAILTGGNVMQVLYLARKHKVPSLVDTCTEFFKNDLNADNALCILREAGGLRIGFWKSDAGRS